MIELKTNKKLKASFNDGEHLTKFWLQYTISQSYPGLWTVVKNY